MRFCTAFAACIALSAAAHAQVPKDLVQATLLADVKTVKAGEPINVGVLLKMKPHWHVYWKYPGDSGAAPRVKWVLPSGFTAGELQFPIPKRFEQPGDQVLYGYEDELLLLTTITPPRELRAGELVKLAADVSWLACEDVCLPGKATLNLELSAADFAAPANEELFAKWRAQLPQTLDQAKNEIKATELRNSSGGLSAIVEWSKPVKSVQWFPLPPEGVGVENAQTSGDGRVSNFGFSLTSAPPGGSPMSFLVAYTDDQDKPRGVEFTVKLPPAKK